MRKSLILAAAVALTAGLVPLTHANAATVITKTTVSAHVQVDQFGTYYCFGRRANVIGTQGNDWYEGAYNGPYGKDYSDGVTVLAIPAGAPRVFVMLAGADSIHYTRQGDYICTGDDNDTLGNESYAAKIELGAGNDLAGMTGASQIYAGPGDDLVYSELPGQVHGGAGNDKLWSHPSDNVTVYGDGGSDRLSGRNCYGGSGQDSILSPPGCTNFTE